MTRHGARPDPGRSVLIMAGGTGGHVFPGLAVARRLREQSVNVVWLGTREGIEARVVPPAGIEIEYIQIRGLRGGGVLRWLLLPLRLNVAMLQAFRILRRRRPDAVLAMGGFAAGPGGMMASLLGIPLVVHEQNAIPGFTNRLLARLADRVLCAFPAAFGGLAKAYHVGNPVRREIAQLPAPGERLANRRGRLRLLIVGGSQGATVFNEVMPEAIRSMPESERPEVWHQCGRDNLTTVQQQYESRIMNHESRVRVSEFIDDMAAAYAWADVVLCRAGAMTIAELAAAGAASILVPYPHAADDHQTANAQYLAGRAAATLLPQTEFSAARVRALLADLAANREVILRMAQAARGCAIADADEVVARECLEAIHA
ncbi:MAG: undecaprenyldiphospho-muramoylpentapeptide beta-N-acetylglucosaminyltransferase [Candidatus Muproteobacteria bacterium RBG_16_65_34]|uniref:UDP-N-acetylglucosamine--N-acetylmuramyl-(pentapeptide) pyrophosphoryl-undecaprenol N-acetylglucosamine transferase n=1 Tax=Candidatus Muproteobacteria bacterium RBG_16_65_34 TaxID=1817760 RepID=A0A1F6TQH4_9PROT|nr:MAG: undecaprenyldiphospho-muramoylpentapeptide beta-N-acetylglucosaminyltransferase [Candidatus Muproteobacteria bacterium RBG_16_65_34]